MEDITLDPAQEERLARLPADGITVFTLESDTIRGALVNGTSMVSRMRAAHRLGILETVVLGNAYLAAALLSVTLKGQDKLSLRAQGSGPAKGFIVDCDSGGNVRGRLFVPAIELDAVPESLDSAPLVGTGFLSLTRYPEGKTEPVTGTAEMTTGRLAEDLAAFYHISEQTRTSFSMGVHFAKDGSVDG
ncbi:MAG TPA: Hsp33 family molecular chaperone HslO, partial [Spirochaetales bacterium]|nr:Hsp33 family molecular chaperone HslO [Spirochaetales bacterium]